MRALTVWQPWASLVAVGAKRVETRSWSTSYRGPLAIHAGAALPPEHRELCNSDPFFTALERYSAPARGGARFTTEINPYELPLGAVVALCELVEVLPIEDLFAPRRGVGDHVALDDEDGVRIYRRQLDMELVTWISDWFSDEAAFGDYTPGRYAWILADVRRLEDPVPARGHQLLWDWDPGDLTAQLGLCPKCGGDGGRHGHGCAVGRATLALALADGGG